MRLTIALPLLAAAAALSFTSVASAAGKDMNDATYIAVARCAGIAQSTGGDVAPFKTVLDVQSTSRTPDVIDRADTAREDAQRNAIHAGSDGKARYIAERDGECRTLVQ